MDKIFNNLNNDDERLKESERVYQRKKWYRHWTKNYNENMTLINKYIKHFLKLKGEL